MLRWLEYSELTMQPDEPQAVSLMANLEQLRDKIPIAPRLIPTSEGPPSPMFEWYGRIGERLVVIECPSDLKTEGLIVWTPFISANRGADWMILHELKGLPSCVFVTRPHSIQSRTRRSNYVVYRPHERGWNDAIYVAASRGEAEALLDFLSTDSFNASCFIGDAEPEGHWGITRIVNGKEEVLGAYPSLSGSLQVGCNMSMRNDQSVPLKVRDLQPSGAAECYWIVNGRVMMPDRSGEH